MKRQAMAFLKRWKEKKNRKPLVIKGARQVGKTWLMKAFGKRSFKNICYINFDNNKRMERVFEMDYDISRIINALQIESGVEISPKETLIIFDEIQEVPKALSALKYFNETASEYFIIAAGSLLGVSLHNGVSFPVGKVEFLNLYPLNFMEFLEATGNKQLSELIIKKDFELIKAFKDKFIEQLKHYYFVGGMPEAVASFIHSQDFDEVRDIQQNLLSLYEMDFSKHAPAQQVPRIRMVWNSIPAQLSKENRKFVYGLIREGARAKDFELAIQWLNDCGLIHKVQRINKPGLPIKAYIDLKAFKIFLLDVGLLNATGNVDIRTILEGNDVFKEFKGALTEQYVLQQLIAQCQLDPYYYSAERSSGEIDFIIQKNTEIIPIEVKAEENLKSKSLRAYSDKYKPRFAVRTSLSDFRKESWLMNLPLYAISLLDEIELL
ncbi:MAG: ATP-binding protein [Thermotogota bacterium]|nr:ATP-binding protein [Thermotogota bacterium]